MPPLSRLLPLERALQVTPCGSLESGRHVLVVDLVVCGGIEVRGPEIVFRHGIRSHGATHRASRREGVQDVGGVVTVEDVGGCSEGGVGEEDVPGLVVPDAAVAGGPGVVQGVAAARAEGVLPELAGTVEVDIEVGILVGDSQYAVGGGQIPVVHKGGGVGIVEVEAGDEIAGSGTAVAVVVG